MGATCYGLGKYGDGDYWFEEAQQRGADIKDIDKEIKRLVKETSNRKKRKEIIEYLLKKIKGNMLGLKNIYSINQYQLRRFN